jgi:hypothetical protein
VRMLDGRIVAAAPGSEGPRGSVTVEAR